MSSLCLRKGHSESLNTTQSPAVPMAHCLRIQALARELRGIVTDCRWEDFDSDAGSTPPSTRTKPPSSVISMKTTADVDTAIDRACRQIDLLQEYRTRLIADVVTGKLDVREAAASLLEEADERDPLDEVVPLADDVVDNLYHRVGRGAGNGK